MPAPGNGRATPMRSGAALLEVAYRRTGAGEVVALAGELDAFTEPIVEPLFASFADEGRDVHLDLSGITFLDVRGLHLLDDTARGLDSHGGRLVVERPSRAVTRLWEIAHRSRMELWGGLAMSGPDEVASGETVRGPSR